jgi:uncharacterized cupredoxin-like copper-binding protein
MRPAWRAALAASIALLVAACGGAPSASLLSTATAAPASPADGTPVPSPATRIEVTLSDALRIEPATMKVPAGVPVTFVVTNTGVIEHEFVVGDEEAQAEHEAEMGGQTGMHQDEATAIGVSPGQTKELTLTFPAAGTTLAGCHVAGHYAAGMKAIIEIVE